MLTAKIRSDSTQVTLESLEVHLYTHGLPVAHKNMNIVQRKPSVSEREDLGLYLKRGGPRKETPSVLDLYKYAMMLV